MTRAGLSLRPLPASLALICTGVGAIVVLGFLSVALVPLLVGAGFFLAFLIGSLLFGWAGIEALAAFERWIENDSRFKR